MLNDVGKKVSTNEIITHTPEEPSSQMALTTTIMTSVDPGGGNDNEKSNMSVDT